MIEMMSSTDAEFAPPRMEGMTLWLAIAEKCGWAKTTSGTMTKLSATKTIMNRSQRWNVPEAVTAKSTTTATGTDA